MDHDGSGGGSVLVAGRYRLGPVLGTGGMAVVQEAYDTRLERQVAVKLLRSDLAHRGAVRERFESEARLAARLVHPNVVAVYDSGESDGTPFIVMERLAGDTLADRLRDGPLPAAEVRRLGLEILGAMEVAHSSGVLHRDIKPANILSARDGRWKIGDFGIAKALERGGDPSDATSAGLVVGTPSYLPPERLLGAPASVSSDLYGLGVVLYEAYCGSKPPGAGTLAGVEMDGGTPPRAHMPRGPAVPDAALEGVISRCLAARSEDRFVSAVEMAAALGSEERRLPATSGADPPEGAEPTLLAVPPSATSVLPAAVPAGAPGDFTPAQPAWGPAAGRPPTGGRARPPGRLGPGGRGPGAPVGRRSRPRLLAAAAALLVIAAVCLALVGAGGHARRPPAHAVSPTTAVTPTSAVTAGSTVTTAPPSTATVPSVPTGPAPGPPKHAKAGHGHG